MLHETELIVDGQTHNENTGFNNLAGRLKKAGILLHEAEIFIDGQKTRGHTGFNNLARRLKKREI